MISRSSRYDIRPNEEGWTVHEVWTGCPAAVDGAVEKGSSYRPPMRWPTHWLICPTVAWAPSDSLGDPAPAVGSNDPVRLTAEAARRLHPLPMGPS
jgi:hypothetical protein